MRSGYGRRWAAVLRFQRRSRGSGKRMRQRRRKRRRARTLAAMKSPFFETKGERKERAKKERERLDEICGGSVEALAHAIEAAAPPSEPDDAPIAADVLAGDATLPVGVQGAGSAARQVACVGIKTAMQGEGNNYRSLHSRLRAKEGEELFSEKKWLYVTCLCMRTARRCGAMGVPAT